MRGNQVPGNPVVGTTRAAELLGVYPSTLREYVREGWLSSHTKSGKFGRGRRRYFDPAELAAFKAGGAPAAAEYRKAKGKRRAKA